MNESQVPTNEERIGNLERAVGDLQTKLEELSRILDGQVVTPRPEPSRPHPSGARDRPERPVRRRIPRAMSQRSPRVTGRLPDDLPWQALLDRGPQFWISRVGIGLVLLSIVFLFDYAVDRGWLTPPVRVTFGVALGVALAWIGLAVQRKERWFAQVMLGGASATWYITGFAAFQLFHIVSHPVAFAFMVAVTVFTFWMGIRQDGAVLAVLGAIGGLGTPFFLYTSQGSLPALIGYTCLVVFGISAIYVKKGWRSLLATAVIGAWCVLLVASESVALDDRWALQAGIVVLWLVFWCVPVSRNLLETEDPDRWPRPMSGLLDRLSETDPPATPHADTALLTVVTPLIALLFSRSVWETGDTLWGGLAVTSAVVYLAATLLLHRRSAPRMIQSAHSVAAAVLAAVGIALLFAADIHILLWAVLSIALLYLGSRFGDVAITACGKILSVVVAIWLVQRLFENAPDTAVMNARGLSDLAVIAGLLITSRLAGQNTTRWYLLAAHLAFLGWLWRELSVLPGGDAVVTTTYGAYGLGLLAASATTRKVGLWTLVAAVAKLFLVDLDRVDPFIRILLFLGFGGLFLGISYYYRDRWSQQEGDEDRQS